MAEIVLLIVIYLVHNICTMSGIELVLDKWSLMDSI